jgi:3-isopropylmalate/(R)-2-methylmalate dehydratase small subunit
MEKFESLTAVAAPLLRENIDTDIIVRIERLLGLSRNLDLGKWCFEALRYRPDGSENEDFILNRPPYRGAKILLAGKNFGCGSSREGAVWALLGMGIRCVIAPSFGEIFFGNCFQTGMLPVVLDDEKIRALCDEVEVDAATNLLTVDLQKSMVRSPKGQEFAFSVAPMRREALLRGLDEVGMTITRDAEIASFQKQDHVSRPWIYETVEQQQ